MLNGITKCGLIGTEPMHVLHNLKPRKPTCTMTEIPMTEDKSKTETPAPRWRIGNELMFRQHVLMPRIPAHEVETIPKEEIKLVLEWITPKVPLSEALVVVALVVAKLLALWDTKLPVAAKPATFTSS